VGVSSIISGGGGGGGSGSGGGTPRQQAQNPWEMDGAAL
jgi:hypothetical protein